MNVCRIRRTQIEFIIIILFNGNWNGWVEMPIKRARELFGKRNEYIDVAQKRRGRELFGKRSDPTRTMDVSEDKMYVEPEGNDDDPSMYDSLLFRLRRERRGRVRELLG
uniref:Uncharacterized protein n=1 Tax=Heterorhabditis bacteriophora TaxID=37862 RepID=A0A1I7XS32_HETBA